MKKYLLNFAAGFLSTLIFHQGLLGLIFLAGVALVKPYNMNPTEPLGVPAVISLAFFGGLWGILIGYLIKNDSKAKFWIKAALLGAIGPTAVAFLVVFPLKGIAINPVMIPFGLLLNGMWGFGQGLFMKLFFRK